jgi:mevalonate pyrophosphate decarboxylase
MGVDLRNTREAVMKIAYIVVFYSNSECLQLFKILKNKEFDINMIATPCTITAGCSRAIEFTENDLDKVIEEIKTNSIKIRNVYKRVINGKSLRYVLVKI